MKLSLNAGDWATIAFFALAVALGCFAEAQRQPLPARGPAATTTANQRSSTRAAVAAVGLE
jgi:hypothetical protein